LIAGDYTHGSANDRKGDFYLPRCVTSTVLLELLDHTIEIGIASPKAPCEPVPTAFRNPFAVSNHLELTNLARRKDGVNIEALFDEGHETRDLGLVVLSCRAVNDLDPHLFSKTISRDAVGAALFPRSNRPAHM
jgi:hypothetical protein